MVDPLENVEVEYNGDVDQIASVKPVKGMSLDPLANVEVQYTDVPNYNEESTSKSNPSKGAFPCGTIMLRPMELLTDQRYMLDRKIKMDFRVAQQSADENRNTLSSVYHNNAVKLPSAASVGSTGKQKNFSFSRLSIPSNLPFNKSSNINKTTLFNFALSNNIDDLISSNLETVYGVKCFKCPYCDHLSRNRNHMRGHIFSRHIENKNKHLKNPSSSNTTSNICDKIDDMFKKNHLINEEVEFENCHSYSNPGINLNLNFAQTNYCTEIFPVTKKSKKPIPGLKRLNFSSGRINNSNDTISVSIESEGEIPSDQLKFQISDHLNIQNKSINFNNNFIRPETDSTYNSKLQESSSKVEIPIELDSKDQISITIVKPELIDEVDNMYVNSQRTSSVKSKSSMSLDRSKFISDLSDEHSDKEIEDANVKSEYVKYGESVCDNLNESADDLSNRVTLGSSLKSDGDKTSRKDLFVESRVVTVYGIKCFKCPCCEHLSRSRSQMRNHFVAKHTAKSKTETLRRCKNCEFRSTKITEMRRHTYSCPGDDKPPKCYQCDVIFETRYDLKKHRSEHHSSSSSAKPFHCPFCIYQSNTKYSVEAHLMAKHTAEHLIKCSVCHRFDMTQNDASNFITESFRCKKCTNEDKTSDKCSDMKIERGT